MPIFYPHSSSLAFISSSLYLACCLLCVSSTPLSHPSPSEFIWTLSPWSIPFYPNLSAPFQIPFFPHPSLQPLYYPQLRSCPVILTCTWQISNFASIPLFTFSPPTTSLLWAAEDNPKTMTHEATTNSSAPHSSEPHLSTYIPSFNCFPFPQKLW